MQVQVRLFASLREEVGRETVALEVENPADVQSLLRAFSEAYPRARSVEQAIVAVNQEVADGQTPVQAEDEVALLPPVSGGRVERIVQGDFETEAVLQALRSPKDGALVAFYGSVRDNFEGREVRLLRYEVYDDMAEAAIRRIEEEVRAASGADQVFVQHRVGELAPGEHTILVAAAAPHRHEAFEACQTALERVKTEVPVWKKELYADGGEAWVEGHAGPPPSPEK
ncbi:MAG: molybdopterin converting factor subunit 1 [Thermoplasmata archaeon]